MYPAVVNDRAGVPVADIGAGLFSDDKPGIDLSGLVLFLRRRWKLIVATALVIAIVTALVLLQATPLYSATASVAVQSQKTKVVDIQDVMSGLSPDQATMETQAAILRSRRLAGILIDKLDLMDQPEFNTAVRDRQHLFSLMDPSTWLADTAPKPAKLTPEALARQRAAAVSKVVKAIAVAALPRSYVLTIVATSERPQLAADMANALSDIYITDGISSKYDATKKASAYLQDRVEELRSQTVATDRAAQGYQSSAGLLASGDGATVAGQQMSELNTQLISARVERAAKEAQLGQINRLRAGGGDGGVEASGAILQSPLIQSLRDQEGQVVRKLGELRASYGERHPKIINAEAELRDLRSKIADEVGKIAASTANDVAISRAREGTLASSLSRVEGSVRAGGAASVRLRELQRESEANRSVYEVFLNRLKETNQQVDLQQADARIVSTADIPLLASFPKVRETLIAAILLGIFAGTALAFSLERLDNTVRSANLLESIGGGATLAFIPTVLGNDRPEDVLFTKPSSVVPEALRTLRSSLALADVDNPPQMVMLSSSVPAEGKTFISVGLARTSAQAGARTIIVDCDTRHPRVHKALGANNDNGLVQVLAGKVSLEEALQFDELSGLHVLTAGKGAVNPPELLRSEQMSRLLARLRQDYAFIVLDTPPFAPLTDSQILAKVVDKMILVVRWGDTPLPVVQGTIKQLRRIGAPLAGSVLSQVDVNRHAKYGYGDYGYHYSKYGSYYGTAS